MKRLGLLTGLIVVGTAAAAVIGIEYLGKTEVDPIVKRYQSVQSRHLNLYLEDQDFLQRYEIFKHRVEGQADAGGRLNLRLVWSPISDGNATLTPIAISKDLAADVLRLRSDWMRHFKRLLHSNHVDFSILDGIEKFDFWDIEKQSPLGLLIEKGVFIPPETLPSPETIDLQTLAKLRLSLGAKSEEPMVALKQVRNLALLMLTTENLQLMLSGLSLLDVERVAYRFYVDRNYIEADAWEPIPRNITRRASRAIRAAPGYLQIWTDSDVLKQVFLDRSVPVGFCAAANESLPKILAYERFLRRSLPLERDFRENYKTLDAVYTRVKSQCRVRYLRRMEELDMIEKEYPAPGMLSHLPYTRKIFALRASTIPFPGFDAYEDGEAP